MNGDWGKFYEDVRILKDKYGVRDADVSHAFEKAIRDTEHENIFRRAEITAEEYLNEAKKFLSELQDLR